MSNKLMCDTSAKELYAPRGVEKDFRLNRSVNAREGTVVRKAPELGLVPVACSRL